MVKIVIFALTHSLRHRITRKVFKIDMYMLRGVSQASNSLFIHGKYRVVVAEASPEENKNVGCGTRKRLFFALAV